MTLPNRSTEQLDILEAPWPRREEILLREWFADESVSGPEKARRIIARVLAELGRFGHAEIINALKMLTLDPKGRHYTGWDAAAWAGVILGGGWSGSWSLRRSSSSDSSGSGCV